MKIVYAKEEVCAGCKLCEVSCIVAHSRYPRDIVKAFKKGLRPAARVIVEENRPVSFALQCRHCEDAPCTKACITGAMHKDPATGMVINEEARCVGCWTCILACPFGAITRHESGRQDKSGRKVAAQCDLCSAYDGVPACVAHCPNDALVFEERKQPARREERVTNELRAYR